jgi:stearoyl-CoA desaturase (delta-9 desaturase)
MSIAAERPTTGIADKKAAEVLPTVANVVAKRNTISATEVLKRGTYNWFEVAWLTGTAALGLGAFTQPFSASYIPLMVGIYLWIGFSVTLYLHRYMTHKGFELNEGLQFIFALGSAVGFSGDPVGWVAHHRHHHKFSDTLNDVHSPRFGWWHAHMAWFLKESREFDHEVRKLAPDCRKIWYLRLLENRIIYGIPHFIVAGVIFYFFGWAGLLYGLYLPITVMHHHTWAINSLTHMSFMGYRTYETDDDSVNSPWLLGALGEGWHNNHHADARRVPHGLKWYEIDVTKYLIWTLEKVGLARDVQWQGTQNTPLAVK